MVSPSSSLVGRRRGECSFGLSAASACNELRLEEGLSGRSGGLCGKTRRLGDDDDEELDNDEVMFRW